MSPEPAAQPDPEQRPAWIVLGVALALHAALLAYFLPRGLAFSGKPIHAFDYAFHVYGVDRALVAFRQSGQLWSYDPFVLAGQPAGIVEDVTSKSVELFVILAAKIGANPFVAFNVYVLGIHIVMPAVAWASARAFRLGRLAAAVTVLAWTVLWYFDSFMHWCWYVGMVSWAAASTFIVLLVGLFHRALEGRRPLTYVGAGALATVTTLVHPFATMTLAPPLAALYARGFRRAHAWEHGAIALATLAAASTTLVWIFPAVRFRHYIGTVDAFLWPTLSYVFLDWMDLLKDVLMTGQPVRTAFRTVVFALAAFELVRLRRARDDRFLPLATLIVASFAMAYLSGYSAALRQTQPYRHVGPAMLAAAVAASSLIVDLIRSERTAFDGRTRLALALATLVALPQLGRTALGYLPTLLPLRAPERTAFRSSAVPGLSNQEASLVVMGHSGPPDDYAAIGHFLERAVGTRGRVAATEWVLGEYLPVFTRVPILGGIPQRNVPHVAAHPLRHDPRPIAPGDDPFRRYLEQYAVAAVVLDGDIGPLDARRDLLEPLRAFGGLRVYRVRAEPSYFAEGSGAVVEQAINSIKVTGAQGPNIVLRFHFLETLRCRPNCTVERAPAQGDDAGFLRVAHPPPAFEIYNAYE